MGREMQLLRHDVLPQPRSTNSYSSSNSSGKVADSSDCSHRKLCTAQPELQCAGQKLLGSQEKFGYPTEGGMGCSVASSLPELAKGSADAEERLHQGRSQTSEKILPESSSWKPRSTWRKKRMLSLKQLNTLKLFHAS